MLPTVVLISALELLFQMNLVLSIYSGSIVDVEVFIVGCVMGRQEGEVLDCQKF